MNTFATSEVRTVIGSSPAKTAPSKRNGPSNHALLRLGTKPFLEISSNHSQNGAGIQQEVEDWFDLTLPDFEPVFSFTPDGSAGGFGFTIARAMKAQSNFSQATGVERIDTTLKIRFEGTPGLDLQGTYVGVYERHASEKTVHASHCVLGLTSLDDPDEGFRRSRQSIHESREGNIHDLRAPWTQEDRGGIRC